MSLTTDVHEMHQMMLQGKGMEAFEKFYADNCEMQENDAEPRKGKEANRKFETEFGNSIKEFHGMQLKSFAINDQSGVVFAEWIMDATLKEGNHRIKMEEVSVQHWKNGKIVFERFYYKG